MSWLQSSVKYLRERGVIVNEADGSNIIRCGAERELTLTVFDDDHTFRLARSNRQEQNEQAPEFSVPYPTLDEALLAIWYYYHGQAVQIEGWRIPLHQRPHWSLTRVQFCIANAQPVSAAAFAKHVEHLRKTTPYPYQGMTHDADKHRRYQDRVDFEEFTQNNDTASKLMLRKDLEEGYIVQ